MKELFSCSWGHCCMYFVPGGQRKEFPHAFLESSKVFEDAQPWIFICVVHAVADVGLHFMCLILSWVILTLSYHNLSRDSGEWTRYEAKVIGFVGVVAVGVNYFVGLSGLCTLLLLDCNNLCLHWILKIVWCFGIDILFLDKILEERVVFMSSFIALNFFPWIFSFTEEFNFLLY